MITEKISKIKRSFRTAIELRSLLTEVKVISRATEHEMLPLLEKYLDLIKTPRNPFTIGILKEFKRNNRLLDEDDILSDFISVLNSVLKEASVLEERIENHTGTLFIGDTMDIKMFHTVRFINLANYLLKTIRSFMVGMVEMEVYHQRNLRPGEYKEIIDYMRRNFTGVSGKNFSNALGFFLVKRKESIVASIYELEDISIDEETLKIVEATVGVPKLDPVGLTLVDFINPLFYLEQPPKIWSNIKMWYLDYEKDELVYLELRYAELVALKERGEHNPSDLKLIESYKENIIVSKRRIRKLKESMG